jgi:hypothetical protein
MPDILSEWGSWLMSLMLAAGIVGLVLGWEWWLNRRAQRRWDRGEAESRRQWAEQDRHEAVQRQLQELEDQIWRESLPDWQREAMAEAARQRAMIHQEARRRLGLPEEE